MILVHSFVPIILLVKYVFQFNSLKFLASSEVLRSAILIVFCNIELLFKINVHTSVKVRLRLLA
jgi:hypothetical protein